MTEQTSLAEQSVKRGANNDAEVSPSSGTQEQVTDNAPAPPANLSQKLVAARLSVENVEKKGRNDVQKYDFAKAEDIARAAEKALLAQGLLADFEVSESVDIPIKSKSGSDGLIVKVYGRLIVSDPSTDDYIERRTVGYGSDYPGDKASYKAMTGARKYAFIHLLGIDVGDDPDEDRKGQATDEKVSVVGDKIAKKLVDTAWEIPKVKEKLQLGASWAADRDVGDCSTKAKATKAIATLTFPQMEKLQNRVEQNIKAESDE